MVIGVIEIEQMISCQHGPVLSAPCMWRLQGLPTLFPFAHLSKPQAQRSKAALGPPKKIQRGTQWPSLPVSMFPLPHGSSLESSMDHSTANRAERQGLRMGPLTTVFKMPRGYGEYSNILAFCVTCSLVIFILSGQPGVRDTVATQKTIAEKDSNIPHRSMAKNGPQSFPGRRFSYTLHYTVL